MKKQQLFTPTDINILDHNITQLECNILMYSIWAVCALGALIFFPKQNIEHPEIVNGLAFSCLLLATTMACKDMIELNRLNKLYAKHRSDPEIQCPANQKRLG